MMRTPPLALAGAILMLMAGSLVVVAPLPAAAEEPDPAPAVLTVDVSEQFKEVDHAASGALYGLADDGWPPDEWIAGVSPKMFTQPPPGATHLPNLEPEPVGDTLDVWEAASRNDATVTVRLPDIFPTFPYEWEGDDYWYEQVETMVRAVQDSGADNIYGYEIWNEPQWTWDPSWGDYFEMWDNTYRLIRELDPDTPIIGPSYDRDYENGLREFMTHAVESDTVPDIVSWHELGPVEGLNVGEHVAFYRELERELGIDPLPISINEYGSPRDAGVPGWLARFVARMERAEVDTANLAFWHKPGRLADLLVPVRGGSGPAREAEPTGNYWLFQWYGEMTGHMVQTTPPTDVGRYIEVGGELIPALEGFASADPATRTARVVFGGGEGDIQLNINGLGSLPQFGGQGNVQVFSTEWTGTDGVSDGPVALFEGTYPVRGGSISVPVAGLNETDAYLAVITPAREAPDFEGPLRRYEAEEAAAGAGGWQSIATSPLASNNQYVKPKRGDGELTFTVDAPAAGAYDLGIRYTNRSDSAKPGAVLVNGEESEVVEYEPTGAEEAFSTHRTHVVLEEGDNEIQLGLDSASVGVDYLEVTPFRARFEAEEGEWSEAALVEQDMSEDNFFANYFSGDAYVRDLSQPDSSLRLPVTVPAAGTYQLKIGYSTAGDQEERRDQVTSGHILRVDDGEWQHVVYEPTQYREMIRQTTATVELPAGTSTITLAKNHPDYPGETQPGTVDLDYLDVELVH